VRFLQSANDFPLAVDLGGKVPSWGLSRWRGNRGLRFVPDSDEGFALRGDGRQLLYKGRKQSHRFTILGDGAFEYDCILNREPDSNIIALKIEGAEAFDFFRQPDFIKDPFLAGSYAVYKKETFIGEGTGKLCHIHRPKIIDALGRWTWGNLSITGDTLNISIPEQWLGEAKYPVVVDPTIGTATVGSQTTGPDPDNDDYDRPWIEGQIAVNRFFVGQGGGGTCTASVYTYYDEVYNFVTPCLYTDYNVKPYVRASKDEHDVQVMVSSKIPAGWRTNTFQMDGGIAASSYIWFGVLAPWFTTRFDYGGVCYKLWPDYDTYPELEEELIPIIEIGPWDSYCTLKWSWYFQYTAAQGFSRTLTQGVTLTDTRKLKGDYKRIAKMNSQSSTDIGSLFGRFRLILSEAAVFGIAGHWGDYFRGLLTEAGNTAETALAAEYYRFQNDSVIGEAITFRHFFIFVKLVTVSFVRDYLVRRFLKAREELVVKSPVCRELILESRVH
jgi:hypothetical protein